MQKKIFFILVFFLFNLFASSQSRGPNPGEVYFSTTWYYTEEGYYDMIIYTADHGQHFQPIYVYKHDSGEMPVGQVLADAAEDIIYNVNNQGLNRSFDNGSQWENVESNINSIYYTGCVAGEIYERYLGVSISSDYGDSFELKIDSINMFIELGTQPGELYGLSLDVSLNFPEYIFYSHNYEFNFIEQIHLPDSIAGVIHSARYPILTRGNESNEIYYISWHPPANYKIFRSTDHGQTFELQYIQPDTCDFYYENYSFTAGRGAGEFYVFKGMSWFDGYNTKLQVYYSADYAKTFTMYEHVFDENWTGFEELKIDNCQLINYPNPFSNSTTIEVIYPVLYKNPVIEIFNSNGKIMNRIPVNGNKMVHWQPENITPDIYYYRLKFGNNYSNTKSMILIK